MEISYSVDFSGLDVFNNIESIINVVEELNLLLSWDVDHDFSVLNLDIVVDNVSQSLIFVQIDDTELKSSGTFKEFSFNVLDLLDKSWEKTVLFFNESLQSVIKLGDSITLQGNDTDSVFSA